MTDSKKEDAAPERKALSNEQIAKTRESLDLIHQKISEAANNSSIIEDNNKKMQEYSDKIQAFADKKTKEPLSNEEITTAQALMDKAQAIMEETKSLVEKNTGLLSETKKLLDSVDNELGIDKEASKKADMSAAAVPTAAPVADETAGLNDTKEAGGQNQQVPEAPKPSPAPQNVNSSNDKKKAHNDDDLAHQLEDVINANKSGFITGVTKKVTPDFVKEGVQRNIVEPLKTAKEKVLSRLTGKTPEDTTTPKQSEKPAGSGAESTSNPPKPPEDGSTHGRRR